MYFVNSPRDYGAHQLSCSKQMGSLCSKLSLCPPFSKSPDRTSGHAVLSDTMNEGGGRPLDLREATAEAAERRLQGVGFQLC